MSSSCDNSELVPVPGFGFIPACIRNNIETQYQVSSTLSLVNIESNSSHWLITHSLLSTNPNIVMLLLQAYKTFNVKISAYCVTALYIARRKDSNSYIYSNQAYFLTHKLNICLYDAVRRFRRTSLVNCGCAFCCL